MSTTYRETYYGQNVEIKRYKPSNGNAPKFFIDPETGKADSSVRLRKKLNTYKRDLKLLAAKYIENKKKGNQAVMDNIAREMRTIGKKAKDIKSAFECMPI